MVETRFLLHQVSYRINRLRRRLTCRLTDFGPPPERALLVLCNPRSGSTWLLDALRCHPAIRLHPRYTLFAALGCLGRRYPIDLAVDGGDAVEVEPGRFAGIPTFACAPDRASAASLASPVAIEKLHPHFFDHDHERFLRRLARLEEQTRVDLVYLVRAPAATLASFLRYKRRNPRWNAQVPPRRAADHLRRTYETIGRIARARPGVVVDYAELQAHAERVALRIFETLWPGAGRNTSATLLEEMRQRTARDGRAGGAVRFLGTGDGAGPAAVLAPFEERDLEACRQAYDSVLALRAETRPAA